MMECLLPYLSLVTVPRIMVGLERMLEYRGVRLERFHCMCRVPVYSRTIKNCLTQRLLVLSDRYWTNQNRLHCSKAPWHKHLSGP